MSNQEVVKYYNECHEAYNVIWGLHEHHAIHYGHVDQAHREQKAAIDNANEVLAYICRIEKTDYILDAGCGVGGSSLWLAKRYGCRVDGINVVPRHISYAKKLAHKLCLSHLVSFSIQDYAKTNFANETFTVVWGQDSICHAENKDEVLNEMFRVLKKGGRIVISDIFVVERKLSVYEKKLAREAANAWAVPFYSHVGKFKKQLEHAGFTDIHFTENTIQMFPSIQYLYSAYVRNIIPALYHFARGHMTLSQMKNVQGCRYHRNAFKKKVYLHGVFIAKK